MFYTTTGRIHVLNTSKMIVAIDTEISRYYMSLIPKYVKFNKQRYEPHISVIRNEMPACNFDQLLKYNKKEIQFEYENYIYNDETYLWLNVYSDELEAIRSELGLSKTSKITKSPDGKHRFHTTIGNFKNI